MNGAQLIKKFLLPCGLCAVPFVQPKKESEDMSTERKKNLVRPSELSLYVKDEFPPPQKTGDDTLSYLEEGFGTVRRTITGLYKKTSVYTDSVTQFVDTGLAHSQGALNYLQEESNTMPRIGAIAIGGLAGLILGLRGGKFKKLVYSSTGALTIAAICHPRQAQSNMGLISHYANIIYNFIYGVKPGDEKQLDLQLPDISKFKLPTSFSEFSDVATSAGSSVIKSITSLTNKATETAIEQKQSEKTSEEAKKSK